jgi:hypothetical protein
MPLTGRPFMKNTLVIFSLLILITLLFLREDQQKRPTEPLSEGCVFCHAGVRDPDPSHPVPAFGCYACHLGNPYSLDKGRAHFAMTRNPGDLRVASQTCGKDGCHPDKVARVKTSIMATNRGILRTVQKKLLGVRGASGDIKMVGVSDLMGEGPPQNLAIDLYRKMCGGCHLWKQRGDREGEVGKRGGGCSDCHILDPDEKGLEKAEMSYHPRMTTRIPSENCIKCHNRSARIGLSYFGRFESDGYGTPYQGRGLSSRKLSGNRFFLNLQGDVHFTRSGMECIDCHTATGLMGDGRQYDNLKAQVDITCEACHLPRVSRVSVDDQLARRLVFLNRNVPDVDGQPIGFTEKGTPLYNLRVRDKVVFYRKKDGFPIEMDIASMEKPHHRLAGHGRLSCQACHSAWIPQCYGCHLTYRRSESQVDWLTDEKTPGKWKEARSYLRFSRPALGRDEASRIYPITPCQVFATVFDRTGQYCKDESFKVLAVSAFDPHTTVKGSRGCVECHGDPKVLGLGEGAFLQRGEDWVIRPTYDSSSSRLDLTAPLDGLMDLGGELPEASAVKGARPFNRLEVKEILSVNPCLGCHVRYDDVIYHDFRTSRKRFESDTGLPCRK